MSDRAWLKELGRRPRVRTSGRPVPPMPAGLKIEKDVDGPASNRLEADFAAVVRESEPEAEAEINAMILDAATANRLTSRQAMRLLSELFRRNDGGPGLTRVGPGGELEALYIEGKASNG